MYKALILTCLIATASLAAEKKAAFGRLPAAVQVAAKTEAGDGEIVGASKEIENGRTTYEVETKKDGKSRDLTFDQFGKLLEVEQEVSLDDIPATAKAALQAKAGGGSIKKVESITADRAVSYEAAIVTRSGKHTEYAVNADGTPHRE